MTSQQSGNRVRLSLETLEDRMALSSMGSLPSLPFPAPAPGWYPGTQQAPPGAQPPADLITFPAPAPGWYPGTQQAPPGAQPPTAMADQIFAELAAMLGSL